ncbi:hypothetical protein [Marinobacter sp.]|uniref:hypothetical protein n=1 Tax=Marinobacter sp. TaxID=50741 RepID=UPI003A90A9C4
MAIVRNTFGEAGAENGSEKKTLKKVAELYQKVSAIVFAWGLKKHGKRPLNTQSVLIP